MLKLSDGTQIKFVEKLKGKHYRKILSASTKGISMTTDGQVGMGNYADSVIETFTFLVEEIIDSKGVKIDPTVEYYDELDLVDAEVIYEKLQDVMQNAQKKRSENTTA